MWGGDPGCLEGVTHQNPMEPSRKDEPDQHRKCVDLEAAGFISPPLLVQEGFTADGSGGSGGLFRGLGPEGRVRPLLVEFWRKRMVIYCPDHTAPAPIDTPLPRQRFGYEYRPCPT